MRTLGPFFVCDVVCPALGWLISLRLGIRDGARATRVRSPNFRLSREFVATPSLWKGI